MKNSAACILLFSAISCPALFAMKYILWAMFNWGGVQAIFLAAGFTLIYVWSFFAFTSKWNGYEKYISRPALKWVWVLGFVQLALLGALYHLLPQFFPAIVAEFFFS